MNVAYLLILRGISLILKTMMIVHRTSFTSVYKEEIKKYTNGVDNYIKANSNFGNQPTWG